jgi:aspartyl/asparaginyl beta-hydroxylase (cupin superfamily)
MTMHDWIIQSRPLLEQWIDRNGVDRGQLTRVIAGFDPAQRERWIRDHPLQRAEILCPGLEARPWHQADRFDWVKTLESAYPAIKEEFLQVHGSRNLGAHPNSGNLASSGAWTTFYFYLLGTRFPGNLAACPVTASILRDLPGTESSGMCYFSVMSPGARVAPHVGFINARIRCHLGLVVPDSCGMRVGQEVREWQEGGCLVFDDSFEHEVWNDGSGIRAVLLLDMWHPDLTELEIRALTYMMGVWGRELYPEQMADGSPDR